MDYLIVSLDGPKEVNNRIRLGNLDVYETVVDGVRELVRAKEERASEFPLVELCMTLTDSNQAHIVGTAKLAMELGVDYFAVTFGIFTTPELAEESSAQFREEFGVDPHFYRGFVRDMSRMDPDLTARQIQEVRRMWGTRYKQYPPVEFDVADYYRQPEKALTRSRCIAPWVMMQVMPNGDLAYCDDFPDLIVGNVRDGDPLATWNGPGSRAWRRRIRTKGIFGAETRCAGYYLQ
jgi:MoaA/NifB/PqqE/SkfB family radical SAM enzyme